MERSRGLTTAENAELRAAKKRIAELEVQLAVTTKAVEAFKADADPKDDTRPVELIAAQDLPVQVASRVLSVAESGYYASAP